MNIETLLYVYLFICSSMIVFNIVTAIVLKKKDARTERVSRHFRSEIMRQTDKIKSGEGIDEAQKKYLVKKLGRIGNMIAFDQILEKLYRENKAQVLEYLSQLGGVIIYLTIKYGKKDRIEAAYFPYIIKKYHLIENRPLETVISSMLELLDEPSIYCRENAMQALYTTGDSECIIKALKKIDASDLFFHEKLLADGLLSFAGDHEELCKKMIESFRCFTIEMQVALLNFLRFDSGAYAKFAFEQLKNENTNDEVRYACIRYLGKYRYDAAYEYLMHLADKSSDMKWEYSAIASSALAIYPGCDTVALLKRNLYSKNWYIRFNSSQSLERLGLTYLDLIDVMEGKDRYATEILRYRFDIKNITENGG